MGSKGHELNSPGLAQRARDLEARARELELNDPTRDAEIGHAKIGSNVALCSIFAVIFYVSPAKVQLSVKQAFFSSDI